MRNNWKRKKVSDICELIVDCVNKTAPTVQEKTPYRMIRTTNIRNGRLDLSETKSVTKETFDIWTRRAKVKKGDILLTREAPLGEIGLVRDDDSIFLGQRIMQYRADSSKVVPLFLYYSFLGYDAQSQIRQFGGIGSTVEHIRVPDCSEIEINTPTIEDQTVIAETLSSLDEKIELNRKQNRTLEAIAQALFKRWFVEFEFPDENGRPYKSSGGAMQPSELGEIPVGWNVGCIGDFVELGKEGVNPCDRPEDAFCHFSIPNFDDGQTAKSELGSTILSNKFAVLPNSILVSKLNPRFPRIWPVLNLPSELSVCSTEFQV
jgi:type I restriction enzyme S subunit